MALPTVIGDLDGFTRRQVCLHFGDILDRGEGARRWRCGADGRCGPWRGRRWCHGRLWLLLLWLWLLLLLLLLLLLATAVTSATTAGRRHHLGLVNHDQEAVESLLSHVVHLDKVVREQLFVAATLLAQRTTKLRTLAVGTGHVGLHALLTDRGEVTVGAHSNLGIGGAGVGGGGCRAPWAFAGSLLERRDRLGLLRRFQNTWKSEHERALRIRRPGNDFDLFICKLGKFTGAGKQVDPRLQFEIVLFTQNRMIRLNQCFNQQEVLEYQQCHILMQRDVNSYLYQLM